MNNNIWFDTLHVPKIFSGHLFPLQPCYSYHYTTSFDDFTLFMVTHSKCDKTTLLAKEVCLAFEVLIKDNISKFKESDITNYLKNLSNTIDLRIRELSLTSTLCISFAIVRSFKDIWLFSIGDGKIILQTNEALVVTKQHIPTNFNDLKEIKQRCPIIDSYYMLNNNNAIPIKTYNEMLGIVSPNIPLNESNIIKNRNNELFSCLTFGKRVIDITRALGCEDWKLLGMSGEPEIINIPYPKDGAVLIIGNKPFWDSITYSEIPLIKTLLSCKEKGLVNNSIFKTTADYYGFVNYDITAIFADIPPSPTKNRLPPGLNVHAKEFLPPYKNSEPKNLIDKLKKANSIR